MSVAELAITQRIPRIYTDYSLERKAEVLAMVAANGGNVDRVAAETGIAHQTIRYWLSRADYYSQLRSEKEVAIADQCEDDARYYLHLARGKAVDAPYNHLMTGAAIAIDKMQLLRNLPTSITLDLNSSDLASVLQGVLGEVIDVTPGSNSP